MIGSVSRRLFLAGGFAGFAGLAIAPDLSAGAPFNDPDSLYAALGRSRGALIPVGDRTIRVVFEAGAPKLDQARILAWIRTSATAMSHYFGHFPVQDYALLIVASEGARVGHATTFGFAGPATRIAVGRKAGSDAFSADWVLVHEMFHAALPDLPRRALWMQEGNATWLEPVARAAAGQLPVSEVWSQAIAGMPRGEPDPGATGLDGTNVHDRLYWGGATFWLLAEIAIQQQSGGRHTLRSAMRAVNRASGGIKSRWTPERMIETCDAATQTRAMTELYATFANTPQHTDLDRLFARLGVAEQSGAVRFDQSAELASIRRQITAA